MKYNDPNYHKINYSNYSLKELYDERINIINNNYNYYNQFAKNGHKSIDRFNYQINCKKYLDEIKKFL